MRMEKRNELPEVCFSVLPGMGNLIILKRDETGYYPSEWDTGNKAENARIADLHNEAAGINPAQVGAMQIGSMCGFHVPGANPQEFFDKAKLIETVSAKGIIKDPVISMFTPIEAELHRYEVAGKTMFYLDLATMPEPIMSRWSHSIILPDLVRGKPLVPVSVDWHENSQCTLTLESGCCVHERQINAGYQIIAAVEVGPVEYALAEYGIPAGISLNYGPYGKPFLPGEDLCFSLSHSGEYVMLAAGRRKCGCDLEQIETANLDIARRFFHPAEYRQLCEAPSEKRNHLFYRFWTLKESYMKMTGEGFHLSPSDFRIGIGEEDIFLEREGIYEAYHFAELSLLPSYCCSVCTEGTLPEPNVKSLDLRSVIRQLAKNRQKTDR